MRQIDKITIANVAIRRSATDHELLPLHSFLKIPLSQRHQLISQKSVEFIDFSGKKIPFLDALKSITALIQQLRSEGKYGEYMKQVNDQ
ncbi:MAG: hypothetical protein ACNS62_05095 [Candidatus Cyclobacteriaceae bacterium M3_2C_046]